jgi:hypothetical protein
VSRCVAELRVRPDNSSSALIQQERLDRWQQVRGGLVRGSDLAANDSCVVGKIIFAG